MNDCEQFEIGSRKRSICDGTAELSEEKINAYRVAWGLPPLTEFPDIERINNVIHNGNDELPKKRAQISTRSSINQDIELYGAGTELTKLMQDAGVPSCQSCKDLAKKMNQWGAEECKKRTEEIIADIMPRAIDWIKNNRPWIHKFLPDVIEKPAVKIKVASYVKKSIEIAETTIEHRRKNKLDINTGQKKKRCGSCTTNRKNRNASPPQIRTPIHEITPFPFTERPKLNLICHCWANGDGWKKHIEYLKKTDVVFDRRIMGVATGSGTATFEEVKKAFGDDWEYFEVANDPKKRELTTYPQMMQMIESTDPNDVTFCIHTKGTQDHNNSNKQIDWWTLAMYETVVDNWENVLAEFERGYSIAGSFRRFGGHFRTRYGWHYSGTFYAFRNARAFSNGMPGYDQKWWGTESWPGQHFSKKESECIFGDNINDMYKENRALEQALIERRNANEN